MKYKLGDFNIKSAKIKQKSYEKMISLENIKNEKQIFDLLDTIDFTVIDDGNWNLITRKMNKSFLNLENFRGYISRYIKFEEDNTEFFVSHIDKECDLIIVKNSKNFIAIIRTDSFNTNKSYYLSMFNRDFDMGMDGVVLKPDNMKKEKEKDENTKKEDSKLADEIYKKSKKDMEAPKGGSNKNQLDAIMKNFEKSGKINYKKQDVKMSPDNKKVDKKKSSNGNQKNKIMNPTKSNKVDNPKKVNLNNIPKGTKTSKNDKKKKVNIPQIKGINSKAKDYTPKKKEQKITKKEYRYNDDLEEVIQEKQIVTELKNYDIQEAKILSESVSNWELSMTLSELGYEPTDDKDENMKLVKKAMDKHGKKYVKRILYKHTI